MWIKDILHQYGAGLGPGQYQLDQDDHAAFALEAGAALSVVRGEAELLLRYRVPVPFDGRRLGLAALRQLDYRLGGALPLQAATRGTGADETLLLVTRVAEAEFSLPRLEQVVADMTHWVEVVKRLA